MDVSSLQGLAQAEAEAMLDTLHTYTIGETYPVIFDFRGSAQ